MSEVKIIVTGDGSHSLLNTVLDETYHSRHGALQESQYVFIKNGLDFFLDEQAPARLSILEIGFGTGLNAWLTLQRSRSLACTVQYTSLETFPLPASIWQSLNFVQTEEDKSWFDKLHSAAWNQHIAITPTFTVEKVETRLQDFSGGRLYDVIYFDAFAPNKQPELWELSVLQRVVNQLNVNGVFVTYCAKGQLKRDLKSLGLRVESLPGPPGKREMIRAVKIN